MNESRPDSRSAAENDELLARLAAHGTLEIWPVGFVLVRKGEPVEGLSIIFRGHIAHLTDQGGTWRTVIEWRGGDVTGQLPYSRMTRAPGKSLVQEETETLRISRKDLDELPMICPHVTAELVHVMLDRARAFKSSDLQLEKMASLGKLAAGLAHE